MNSNQIVGVIGGLGPMATAFFLELVVDNTDASCDQENVDLLVCQYSSIPDRTAYILNKINDNPLPKMILAAKQLQENKCSFIVMPCNTACYFYDEIEKNITIPMLNIVEETTFECQNRHAKKIGLMATDGTIKSKVYEKYLSKDQELFLPNENLQKKIMSVIYDYVKKNKQVNYNDFMHIIDYFKANNCDVIVSGCTEISVVLRGLQINDNRIIDSLTILARKTVVKSGKRLK